MHYKFYLVDLIYYDLVTSHTRHFGWIVMKNIFVNSRNQIAELAFVALDTASGSTYVGPQIISSLSA